MMRTPKHAHSVLCCMTGLVFLSMFVLASSAEAETYTLTILHTNDHHGHFAKFSPFGSPDSGGLAAQSTLVNIVRAEVEEAGGYTVVLSAGDVNMGVPESDMLDAEPDFKLMNLIGYDAMTLGNHEFDKPREVLLKQQEWAEFPFLSANIVKKDSGEYLVEPYIIKEFDGLSVAIFGLTTQESPILVTPGHVEDLEFKDVVETAKALVPKLREEADVVIALTHLGFFEESGGGYNSPGDVKLAKEVPGIDVIVGGHSHDTFTAAEVVENTVIVQAGEWSQFIGRLDLTIDTEADKVTNHTFRLLPVNMKKRVSYNDKDYFMYSGVGYVEDNAMIEAMQPYMSQADELLSQPIGEALVKLDGDRKLVRAQETNLANIVTDSMCAKTGAEIALQNGGGIRADIEQGTITYRDVLKVQPFGNTLVLVDVTGAQLMELLDYAATIQPGNGAFLQVAGLTWTLNRPTGKADNVQVGGQPINLERTYKVVTNNFMGAGGDGYSVLKDLPKIDTGYVDADSLREYIAQKGKVGAAVEGRLTIVE